MKGFILLFLFSAGAQGAEVLPTGPAEPAQPAPTAPAPVPNLGVNSPSLELPANLAPPQLEVTLAPQAPAQAAEAAAQALPQPQSAAPAAESLPVQPNADARSELTPGLRSILANAERQGLGPGAVANLRRLLGPNAQDLNPGELRRTLDRLYENDRRSGPSVEAVPDGDNPRRPLPPSLRAISEAERSLRDIYNYRLPPAPLAQRAREALAVVNPIRLWKAWRDYRRGPQELEAWLKARELLRRSWLSSSLLRLFPGDVAGNRRVVATLEALLRSPARTALPPEMKKLAESTLVSLVQDAAPGVHASGLVVGSRTPAFLNFTALYDYKTAVYPGLLRKSLAGLSPSARIAVELHAYAALMRGQDPAAVRERALLEAQRYAEREARFKSWKPTVGVELELMSRTLPSVPGEHFQHTLYHWTNAAEFVADMFGVHVTPDVSGGAFFEYSPGPGFDWRTAEDMIDALRDVGLVPPAHGDYAKLHITMVHARPDLIGLDSDEWRWYARSIAFVQGVLATSQRRLSDALLHLTAFRREEFRFDSDFISLNGTRLRDNTRGEYIAGSVDTDPLPAPGGHESSHRKQLRLVDTLHTAMIAYYMDKADPGELPGGGEAYRRFWAEDAPAKRRLAKLYGEFSAELYALLSEYQMDSLIAQMGPWSKREGDFTRVRQNAEFTAKLQALVDRYLGKMDALISPGQP